MEPSTSHRTLRKCSRSDPRRKTKKDTNGQTLHRLRTHAATAEWDFLLSTAISSATSRTISSCDGACACLRVGQMRKVNLILRGHKLRVIARQLLGCHLP
jgi:hypothetical protein